MCKFTENGITVNFDSNYFQFEDCSEYKKISGHGVKEMDFGWIDTAKKVFWLIELKGYINPEPLNTKFQETDLSQPDVISQKINELLLKSIHSVCMIDNKRSNTKCCMPFEYRSDLKIKLIHILNIRKEHILHLTAMSAKLNSEFAAYKAIFNIDKIILIDYDNAKKMLSFVS